MQHAETMPAAQAEAVAQGEAGSNCGFEMRNKHPDRIPVVVEKAARSDIATVDKKKYLVPANLTMGQFVYVIRKRIDLSPETAIFIYVDNVLPPTSSAMSLIYEEYKDKDGFLHITYSGENTFGGRSCRGEPHSDSADSAADQEETKRVEKIVEEGIKRNGELGSTSGPLTRPRPVMSGFQINTKPVDPDSLTEYWALHENKGLMYSAAERCDPAELMYLMVHNFAVSHRAMLDPLNQKLCKAMVTGSGEMACLRELGIVFARVDGSYGVHTWNKGSTPAGRAELRREHQVRT